jgi:hypothetical protein
LILKIIKCYLLTWLDSNFVIFSLVLMFGYTLISTGCFDTICSTKNRWSLLFLRLLEPTLQYFLYLLWKAFVFSSVYQQWITSYNYVFVWIDFPNVIYHLLHILLFLYLTHYFQHQEIIIYKLKAALVFSVFLKYASIIKKWYNKMMVTL